MEGVKIEMRDVGIPVCRNTKHLDLALLELKNNYVTLSIYDLQEDYFVTNNEKYRCKYCGEEAKYGIAFIPPTLLR